MWYPAARSGRTISTSDGLGSVHRYTPFPRDAAAMLSTWLRNPYSGT